MENFGPYQDPLVYDIQNNMLTAIVGPNGVGKTMSLEALPFTLYGMTSKGARGDDVVNNIAGKDCKTWVRFTVDSDEYLATRYHKYTKLGNTVTLDKNGEIILKGHREVTPAIENLIMPRKLFMNTRMFGQKVKDFFTDIVDSERKDIFRMVLELDNYVEYCDNSKLELKDIESKINELNNQAQIQQGIDKSILETIEFEKEKEKKFAEQKEQKILEIKNQIDVNRRLLEKWESTMEDLKNFNMDLDPVIQELSNIRTELKHFDDKLKVKRQEIEQKKQQKISDLKYQSNQKANEISQDARKKITTINSKIENKNEEYRVLQEEGYEKIGEYNKEIHKHEDEIFRASDSISELSQALKTEEGQCPTCLREITSESKEHLKREIQKYKKIIAYNEEFQHDIESKKKTYIHEADLQSKNINNEISSLKKSAIQIETEEVTALDENEKKLHRLIEQVNDLEDVWLKQVEEESMAEKTSLLEKEAELAEKKKEIEDGIESFNHAEKNHLTVTNTLIDLNSRLDEAKQMEFDRSNIIAAEKKIEESERKLLEIRNNISYLTEDAEVVSFWKKGFSPTGIPSMLIDDAIPFMNKTVTKYLDKISNGRYLVSFDTMDETKSGQFRDKISVKVLDTHTHANSRIQLSGGQERLIDIATILTLGELQEEIQDVSFNILIFDEIFDSLDDENITYVSKVLRKLLSDELAMFIISHRYVDQLDSDITYNL